MKRAVIACALVLVGCSSSHPTEDAAGAGATAASTSQVTEAPAKVPGIACDATRDSFDMAVIAYLADRGSYPSTIGDVVAGAYVSIPEGVELVTSGSGDALRGPGWTLRLSGGGDTPPAFTCER
jgi:hypothetical protein